MLVYHKINKISLAASRESDQKGLHSQNIVLGMHCYRQSSISHTYHMERIKYVYGRIVLFFFLIIMCIDNVGAF